MDKQASNPSSGIASDDSGAAGGQSSSDRNANRGVSGAGNGGFIGNTFGGGARLEGGQGVSFSREGGLVGGQSYFDRNLDRGVFGGTNQGFVSNTLGGGGAWVGGGQGDSFSRGGGPGGVRRVGNGYKKVNGGALK